MAKLQSPWRIGHNLSEFFGPAASLSEYDFTPNRVKMADSDKDEESAARKGLAEPDLTQYV